MPYPNLICCRLSDEDRDRLHEQAARFQKTPSEYIRYLIRIPVDAKESDGTRCVVLDTDALGSMSRELTKWGYHYNQAVHSMNTISMFIRCGRLDTEYFIKTIDEINGSLAKIDSGKNSLVYSLQEIEKSTLVRDW